MKKRITLQQYQDKQYSFFQPLYSKCKSLLGSGDFNDESNLFIAVSINDDQDGFSFIITTEKTYHNHRRQIQNLEAILQSKHNLKSKVLFSSVAEVSAILEIAEKEIANNESDTKSTDSAALSILREITIKGVKLNASDIHIYIYEERAEVVFRVNGQFTERTPLGRDGANRLVTAGLYKNSKDYRNVSDDEELIDASIDLDKLELAPKKYVDVKLRVSKSDSSTGPHTVFRLITKGVENTKHINEIGLDEDIRDDLIEVSKSPFGIILVTGPTGSGKSTTLAALHESIDTSRKTILLEDPVEYKIARLNTVQKTIYPDTPGKGYKEHLQSALRQDPDIVGVSEIRNKEVAEIVIKSALTGHLMFSTLHTNDALGALTRLVDEGISEKMLGESNLMKAVLAQRLIPKLCECCKISHQDDVLGEVFITNTKGCANCDNGVSGRVLVAELVIFDDGGREFIKSNDIKGLSAYIKDNGWQNMKERAITKIKDGLIDPFEAQKHIDGIFSKGDSFQYKQITPKIVSSKLDKTA